MALQTLRKGASGWIAKLFLMLLVFSFLIWGIADVFRGFGASTVASVGGTEIPAEAFRAQYQEQVQQIGRRTGRAVTPEQARAFGLDRQVLQQMITEATLDAEAARLGLAVSDAQIAREIRENPSYRRPGASEFDPAYFDQLLRANNFTEQRFIAAERKRVVREQVTEALGAGIAVPQTLVDALLRYENEVRTASYILVTPQSAGALPAPTEEQLRAFFDAHKITFRAPEYRKIAVLALTPAALAATVSVSDADARASYDHNTARFGTPERRVVSQIVFPNVGEANAAADKIKAGTAFADIAKARGLTDKDTELGLVEKGGIIDPRVAAAAFALAEGGTSDPVESRFGATLVHVARIEPGSQQPFEQVQAEIVRDLSLERARRQLLDQHDKVEDERAGGATLAETAQKLGLALRTFDAVDRSGRTPDGAEAGVPGGAPVVSGAFSADPGIETDVVQLPDNGGFVWYETQAVIPARERTFDEAKASVTERWTEEETAKAVEAKAKALLEKAQAGTPLAQVAAEADLPIQIAEGLRRGRADGVFSTEAVNAVFDAKEGGLGTGPAQPPPARVVFKVDRVITPPQGSADPRLTDQLSRQVETDMLMQYLAALQKQLGVKINERILAQSVGAGSAN